METIKRHDVMLMVWNPLSLVCHVLTWGGCWCCWGVFDPLWSLWMTQSPGWPLWLCIISLACRHTCPCEVCHMWEVYEKLKSSWSATRGKRSSLSAWIQLQHWWKGTTRCWTCLFLGCILKLHNMTRFLFINWWMNTFSGAGLSGSHVALTLHIFYQISCFQ